MFAGRKVKQLEKALENAAVELTLAEKLGPPPGDESHSAARRLVISKARTAAAAGQSEDVERLLAAAHNHPIFRGEDTKKWEDFVESVRGEL